MSNLGLYQTMTTWSKKMGGPLNLGLAVLVTGYALGKTVEVGGKLIVKGVKKHIEKKKTANAEVYVVHTEGTSNDGLHFSINDRFRALEIADDAVLIEKIGNTNNPYFVSADLLHSISNFNYLTSKGE